VKPGDILGGRFELAERAGAGGMGEVFRAKDRVTGEAVAVKVMQGKQGAASAHFQREG
jgi:eukaryotic-like serine/threonine-protein kinase